MKLVALLLYAALIQAFKMKNRIIKKVNLLEIPETKYANTSTDFHDVSVLFNCRKHSVSTIVVEYNERKRNQKAIITWKLNVAKKNDSTSSPITTILLKINFSQIRVFYKNRFMNDEIRLLSENR